MSRHTIAVIEDNEDNRLLLRALSVTRVIAHAPSPSGHAKRPSRGTNSTPACTTSSVT